MAFFLSPGVYPVETDLSQRVTAIGTSVGSCVLASRKGPVGTTYVTTGTNFISLFGNPDPTWSPAHDCCLAYLEQAPMYVTRVINGATWAGLTVLNNKDFNESPTETDVAYFPSTGALQTYVNGAGSVNYYQLFFSADLVTGNSFTLNVSNGITTVALTPVVYATSSDATMVAIASAVQALLNSYFGTSGWQATAVYPYGQTSDYREIRVIAPIDGQVIISNAYVTSGASQALVTVSQEATLFDVYAANPGAWPNNTVGIKIVDVDTGTQQQQNITFGGAIVSGNQIAMTAGGNAINTHQIVVTFSAAFVTGNTINLTINGQAITPVVYTTSNAYTYQLLQAAVDAVLDTSFSVDYNATSYTLTVVTTKSFTINSCVVTLGASQPTAAIGTITTNTYVPYNQSNDNTLDVLAYAIGHAILGVPAVSAGTGTNKVTVTKYPLSTGFFPIVISSAYLSGGASQATVTVNTDGITFGSVLITGNVFNCQVNGVSITPVYFDTSSDTTVSDIATAINKALALSVVQVVPSGIVGNASAREISVMSPFSGTNVSLSNPLITGGTSQTTSYTTTALNGVAPTWQFTLEVYLSSNINTPVERFLCSLNNQQDGYGNQLNLTYVINSSLSSSQYIKVWQPAWSYESQLIPFLYEGAWDVTPTIIWLQNGSDGNAITSSQINAGWNSLTNTDKYGMRVLINGGYSQVSVQQTMDSLANTRKDCICVLDMPEDYQATATSCVSYRQNVLNIDSTYSALYTPDLRIQDETSGDLRYVPPSGHVGATYAYTDKNAQTWFSPAGIKRGQLYNIQGLAVDYEQGDRDIMSPAQVNAIINIPGSGYVVWDDQTLQSVASALSYVHVRRLLIFIEVSLVYALRPDVFDPNDAFTRMQLVQMVNSFLAPIKAGRGLYRYLVVCDDTNNSDANVAAGQLNCDVYLDPTLQARAIKLQSILTATGASFSELVALGGNL